MTIGERLFSIMKEKNISMPELARMTGISRHTIFDWQRRNTNPGADKIMVICEALQITPEELLIGKHNSASIDHEASISMDAVEIELVKDYKELSETKKKKLLAYVSMLQNTKEKPKIHENAEIITDADGKKIVRINKIRFKGKRAVKWEDVRLYLNEFVGEMYTIACSEDVIYLGKDLPDEYAGSEDTYVLKGALAKAKANAAQGLGAMIEIATEGSYTPNRKEKHVVDAANGWYKYTTRFALPVFGQDGSIERYNVFRGFMIIRHDQNGKKYLYDVIKIKKETSNPPSC